MYRLARADGEARGDAGERRRAGRPWGTKPAGLAYVSLDAAMAEEMAARRQVH